MTRATGAYFTKLIFTYYVKMDSGRRGWSGGCGVDKLGGGRLFGRHLFAP
jgi:hypothetical protein